MSDEARVVWVVLVDVVVLVGVVGLWEYAKRRL